MGGTPSTEQEWKEPAPGAHPPLSSHNECLSPTTTFPHWLDKTVLTTDPDTGYQLLTLLPGTILFKGTRATVSSTAFKRGFYGTFDTAVQYGFRMKDFGGEGETGKVIGFEITKPLPLFLINWENLNLLVNTLKNEEANNQSSSSGLSSLLSLPSATAPARRVSTEIETAAQAVRTISSIFGYRPRQLSDAVKYPEQLNESEQPDKSEQSRQPLLRSSTLYADLLFSQILCERKFYGFASYQMPQSSSSGKPKEGKFHSEVMLCNMALDYLAPLPIEWRVHPAFPKCIFEVSVATGQPLAIIDAKQYGGVRRSDVRDLYAVPRNDKFISAMRELYRSNNLPKWIDSCSCAKDDLKVERKVYPRTNASNWDYPQFPVQKLLLPSSSSPSSPLPLLSSLPMAKLGQSNQLNQLNTISNFGEGKEEKKHRDDVAVNETNLRKRRRNASGNGGDEDHDEGKLPQQRRLNLRRIAKSVEVEELVEQFETFYLPQLVPGMTVKQLRELFTAFTTNFDNSLSIPPKRNAVNIMRVATWNVFNNDNLFYKRDLSEAKFIGFYRHLDADVLVLQELANFDGNHFSNSDLVPKKFEDLGYVSLYRANTEHNSATVLATKIMPTKSYVLDLSQWVNKRYEPRSVLFNLINGIWFISTHLNSNDKTGNTRRLQVAAILEFLDRITAADSNDSKTAGSTENAEGTGQNVPVIWIGDFNATRDKDYSPKQLQWLNAQNYTREYETSTSLNSRHPVRDTATIKLVEAAGFKDVTDLIGERLGLTTWAANRVDFIFLKNIHPDRISQFFPVVIPLSDHLPLVVDIIV